MPTLFASFKFRSILGLCCLASASLMTSHATSSTSPLATINATTPHTMQLADDAERRLRRLGISFNPGRIPRPYDPAGELC